MGIPELNKDNGVWCPHCKPGIGCGIYADRPSSCQEFQCAWLMGLMPEDCRPDRLKAMVTSTDGKVITIWVDSMDRINKTVRTIADNLVRRGRLVILAEGKKNRRALVPRGMTDSDNPLVQIVEKMLDGQEVTHEVTVTKW
jgi:Fe-S-cluster containining protein